MTTTVDVVNYQYDDANRLTSVNGQAYTWDNNGNLLSDGVRTYTYTHANRLIQVVTGTLTTQFAYPSTLLRASNGAGDRVARTVDGVTTDYVLDGSTGLTTGPAAGLTQVLQETTGGQTTNYLYSHDLLAQYDSGTRAYHLNDGLGSVRQLADPAGQVVASYSFSPFGVPLGESGGEPYGFTGEQWDASAGLVYLRARYYSPEVGRFVSKDPWPADMFQPQTFDEWPYVTNNPVNRVDPSGYFSNDEIARSLGVSGFDDVIQVFTGDKDLPPYAGGKWGLLRLLQEAKSNDTLSGLIVSEFGIESRVSIGQFHCKNGTIRLGYDMDLRELLSYLHTLERGTTPPGGDAIIWRSLLQGYYLNGRAFCDGYKTDLPDFATFSLGFDVWAPDLLAGLGVGYKATYTVDRYGRAYLSLLGASIGAGAQPINIGYAEGYVNPWKGERRLTSPEELERLISGWDIGLGGVLVFYSGSAGVNLDRTMFDYWIGMVGWAIPQLEVSLEASYTFKTPYSLNPQGWHWIDELPWYEEKDIPRQRDSDSTECGC